MTVALLDADLICYRVGFASEEDDEKLAIARTTEFVTDIVFFDANCDSMKGFLTGKNNFRKEIAVTTPYKGNRKADKPRHFDAIRKHLIKLGCVEEDTQEADDAIGIAAYSMKPDEYVIITVDKDLNMIRGSHYNFVKRQFNYVDENEALRFFYTQLLTGDHTDNIRGIEGIGPKKAAKALEDATTEWEMYSVAKKMYDNDKLLLENAQLLWIRRETNQLWTPPNEPTKDI